MLNHQSNHRIIIHDCEEEEEGEGYAPSVEHHSPARNCLDEISNVSFSRYTILALLLALLLLACLALLYLNYALKSELESSWQVSDDLLLLQTSIINYQPSPFPLPHNKSFAQDKLKPSEIYKFQRMMAHFLTPFTDTDCQLRRYGGPADGGYLLCHNFVTHSSTLLNFGIEGEDSFGCDLLDEHPHLTNYQFDCTRKLQRKCPLDNKTHFSSVCVGDQDVSINGRQYNRMETIIQRLKVNESNLIVKMDVEGSEWISLAHTTLETLERIDQLVIELHLGKPEKGLSWHHLGLIRQLSSKFVPVNTHMNNYDCFGVFQPLHYLRASSLQVSFVNRRLITLLSHHRSFQKNILNAPNAPSHSDCQQS